MRRERCRRLDATASTRSPRVRRIMIAAALAVLVATAGCGQILNKPESAAVAGNSDPIEATGTPSTATATFTSAAAGDNDGLAPDRERQLGTNPHIADTDGDGLDDGAELANGTDPLVADSDADGLADGAELANGTDPLANDTDGDGLLDAAEVANATDPTVADTDADGLSDGRERELGLNATAADTDGDGLTDATEVNGPTDPTSNDTDTDGLADGRELALGTDPTAPDTDGDALLDGWEVANRTPDGVPLRQADPLHKDLYVMVSRSADAWAFREEERTQIRGVFMKMSVSNPDGDSGITVHFAEGSRLQIRKPFNDKGHARRALRQNSTESVIGPRAGVYHHVVLMRITEHADFDTYAATPGRRLLIDEDERSFNGGSLSYRDRLIVRGLVQNIAGKPNKTYQHPDKSRFTTQGWTAYEPDDLRANEYLPSHISEKLSRDGFATTAND